MTKQNQRARLPIANLSELLALPTIKYKPERPRRYTWNAKAGQLQLNKQGLHPEGNAFSFLPLASRIFEAEILNYSRRKWAELFFVNQLGHLCCFLIHGYSVDSLEQLKGELFYDDADLTDVVLTLAPQARTSENGNYFVARFGAEPLNADERQALHMLRDSLPPIFSAETLTDPETLISASCYGTPEILNPPPEAAAAEAVTDTPNAEELAA